MFSQEINALARLCSPINHPVIYVVSVSTIRCSSRTMAIWLRPRESEPLLIRQIAPTMGVMWQSVDAQSHAVNSIVLRELTDFGHGKLATVSTQIAVNRWLVLSESIDHTDHTRVDWGRMTSELYASGDVVEAQ